MGTETVEAPEMALTPATSEEAKPRRPSPLRTCIMVIGMHRSGTSALTRVINLLGAKLPSEVMPPLADNNELGFWESTAVYAFHEELLQSAGSSWDDWRRFSAEWMRSPLADDYVARAVDLLETEFGESPFFVVKDPRVCRFVPFWRRVLATAEIRGLWVLPIRNPSEVAASLRVRDGFLPSKSELLWLRHVLDAEHDTRGTPRAFLTYTDLLSDWRRVVGMLADRLSIGWPRLSAKAEVEIDRFIETRHRHQRVPEDVSPPLGTSLEWVPGAYAAMRLLSEGGESPAITSELDRIRNEFDRAGKAVGAVIYAAELERDEARSERDAAQGNVDLLERRIQALEEQLAERTARARSLEDTVAERDAALEDARSSLAENEQRVAGLVAERDTLAGSHEAVQARVDALERAASADAQRIAALSGERDELAAVRDRLVAERDALTGERDELAAVRDRLVAERDALTGERDELAAVRDRLVAERDALTGERDELVADRDRRASERDQLVTERDELTERVEALTNHLADKERLLAESLAKHQRQIAEMTAERDAFERAAAEGNRRVHVLETRVEEKEAGLRTERARADRIATDLTARDERIAALDGQLSERNQRIASLDVETAILGARAEWLIARLVEDQRNLRAREGDYRALRSTTEHHVFELVCAQRRGSQAQNGLDRSLDGLAELGTRHSRLAAQAAGDGARASLSILVRRIEKRWPKIMNALAAAPATVWWGLRLRLPARGRFLRLAQRIEDSGLFDGAAYLARYPEVLASDPPNLLIHWLTTGVLNGWDPHPAFDLAWYKSTYLEAEGSIDNPLEHYIDNRGIGYDPNPLFDSQWYLANNPQVAESGMTPLTHYLVQGADAGLDPNPLFDSDWYLAMNPEVADTGENPLVHYITQGAANGRNPHPLFDTDWYASNNPDVVSSGLNPLAHFLRHGAEQGRDPHPLFDGNWYRSVVPGLADDGFAALRHYLETGATIGQGPNALFDAGWYTNRYPDVTSDTDPFQHYLEVGEVQGRDPNPLFDVVWYTAQNPDIAQSGLGPLAHYIRIGSVEGRAPHPLFDARWYLDRYQDVAAAGMDPLAHYLHWGVATGRDPHPLFASAWYVEQNADVAAAGWNPLAHFLTWGANEGRFPNPLFDPAWYSARYPDVVERGINPLVDYVTRGIAEGRDPNPLFDTDWYIARYPEIASQGFNPLADYLTEGAAAGRDPNPLFDTNWYYTRLEETDHNPLAHYMLWGADEGRDPNPLFDSDWYLERYPEVAEAGLNPLAHYLERGCAEGYDPNPLFDTDWYIARNRDLIESGINPLVHYLEHGVDKGLDPHPLFDTDWYLAHDPDLLQGDIHPLAHYLSAGGRENRAPSALFDSSRYVNDHPEVLIQGLNPLVHYLGATAGRPDPILVAPRVALPGAATDAYIDTTATTLANFRPASRWANEPSTFRPEVTVVVPCYNHAPYLHDRLESIYAQSYDHFKVLLLDDCSTDGSREILETYAARYPDKTTLLFNEVNSGGVFKQWKRGIAAADSPLVWIAESDDKCDPDFLETLIPFFADEAVMLAYAHSVFVDEQGKVGPFRFEDYVGELSQTRWTKSYVETACKEVATALGHKNTIPNVSSAVFRRLGDLSELDFVGWQDMRICGDWLFYLYAIRGGKLAYSPASNNYYRIHSSNASTATYSKPAYYTEHERVAIQMARWYPVPQETLIANQGYIARFFDEQAQALKDAGHSIDDFYAIERAGRLASPRLPSILMASFGFTLGGGEVFPIRLANVLKRAGYAVTFFDFGGGEYNETMRTMLAPDIPVVERPHGFEAAADILDALAIDIVHTHHASVDRYFAEVRRHAMHPTRQVITLHGMYEAMDDDAFAEVMKALDDVDAWVYIADKNLIPFQRTGRYDPRRFTKIPNGMPTQSIEPVARSDYGIAEDAFVICLASRSIPEKGWRSAIEAVGKARRQTGVDIQLLLLGDGPVYDELSVDGVPAYVHLLGFVTNAIEFYAAADLGLLTSTFKGESFPLTVIECIVAGRPVIASDLGEVRNMMTNGEGERAGELIDVRAGAIDTSALADQITTLANDRDLHAKKARIARELAPRFGMERVLDQYAAVYHHVADPAPAHRPSL